MIKHKSKLIFNCNNNLLNLFEIMEAQMIQSLLIIKFFKTLLINKIINKAKFKLIENNIIMKYKLRNKKNKKMKLKKNLR